MAANGSVPSPFQRERARGGWGERERQKLRDKEREKKREMGYGVFRPVSKTQRKDPEIR